MTPGAVRERRERSARRGKRTHDHALTLAGLTSGYGRERELRPYMALFAADATFTALGVATAVRRRGLSRPTFSDGALLAVGAFRLSRLVTKDKVTGFVRAPFTEWVDEGGAAEVNETPRGEGLRRAIGELLTCPFCFTQWSATMLGIAWVSAPEATRAMNWLFAAATAADVMHVAWTRIEEQA